MRAAVRSFLATGLLSVSTWAQTDSAPAAGSSEEESAGPQDESPKEDESDKGTDGAESTGDGGRAEDAPARPIVVPPRVVKEAPVKLPPGSTAQGQVILLVTVGVDGRATEVTVDQSLDVKVDEAAVASVRTWLFAPAERNGKKLPARIRVAVPVQAVLPREKPVAVPSQKPEQTGPPEDPSRAQESSHEDAHHKGDVHMEITVHGDRPLRTESRGSSDYFVHREVLEAAPHAEGAETLRVAPGLTMFRTEGLAQAHAYSLRGFDADHGQDIEFVVGGLPINMPSHIHGQGYSDLSFLIGDVIDEVAINEGVSDPRQGDFAVAGTVRVGLGVDENRRGLQVRGGWGSFDSPRLQLIWAPKETERESLGAAQFTSTEGFGENRAGKSASGIVQHRFGRGEVTYRAVGFVHGARADSAGVLRQDDIDSGRVCHHCVYDFATAKAQNGLSQRLMSGFFADYRGPDHANGSIGFYIGRDHFRSQQNFTGFLERSRTLPNESGRGDLIEQVNSTTTYGLTGRYRTEAFDTESLGHGTIEVGLDGRFDSIDQSQNLLDGAVRNQIWDNRVDASIQAVETAMWGDIDWQFGRRVQARAGMRAAVLSYDINDRLGNFAPLSRPQDQFLPGFRRSAMGVSIGPRASMQIRVADWVRLLGAYGEGYRSPQARILSDGESAPFARVRSGDAGVRLLFGDPLTLTVSGYMTHLSDDVAFEASEGRMESVGPTRRMGAVAYGTLRPSDWFLAAVSVTYVNTALLEPPPPTAEEPVPPFVKGQPLPFVSPLIVRIDGSAKHQLVADMGGKSLEGRIGVGANYMMPRPLPFNTQGRPIYLLDASASLLWSAFDLSISGFNLLNLDYAAREFMFVSDWSPGAVPSRLPARHIAAGAPLSIMATLGVTL